jgi:hypothetical protein
MPLPIRDGNQSLTTLSTIVVSNAHIPAHTVVSLGTQAKTDILSAVSNGIAISGTVTANVFGEDKISGGFLPIPLSDSGEAVIVSIKEAFGSGINVPISGTVTVGNSVNINSLPAIRINPNYDGQSGNNGPVVEADNSIGYDPRYMVFAGGIDVSNNEYRGLTFVSGGLAVAGTVTIGSALPAGTNRIGVVTIGGGTVTIGAGTSQIGSVTISGTVPISISSVTVGNSVTIGSLPAISGTVTANVLGTSQNGIAYSLPIAVNDSAVITRGVAIGYNDTDDSVFYNVSKLHPLPISTPYGVIIATSVTIGSLPAISGTVTANLSISSTVITSGSFTSLTSATLVPANTARKMATVYNLGAGRLFINAGASATTLGGGFMVALNSGDFYECPYTTTTLSAIFATAGTASWISH